MSESVKIPVVDVNGKELSQFTGPGEVFSVEPNESVVHFVCKGQLFRYYKKTAFTKGRSDVRGGGRKIRKQKGTGGARQGSNRAPHWVGGGVVFGPRAEKREFKVNKKVADLAIRSVLSDRCSSKQILVVKASTLGETKTKAVTNMLGKLSLDKARVGFVISNEVEDIPLGLSARNLKNTDLLTKERWTTLDFVKADTLVFTEKAIEELTGRLVKA